MPRITRVLLSSREQSLEIMGLTGECGYFTSKPGIHALTTFDKARHVFDKSLSQLKRID